MSSNVDPQDRVVDLLAEVKRRVDEAKHAPVFLEHAFPAQAKFIEDPCRLKMAICTRRAGKSMGAALYLLKEAYENPGTVSLYVSLTRRHAEDILWRPCLKPLVQKLGLKATFNETDLTCTLSNGSVIALFGANSGPEEAEKFLGQKFKLVVIDEAASFVQSLDRIVYTILKPAMADLNGTICLIGTPGNIKRGLFFRITAGQPNGEDARWSVHKWGTADNPHMAKAHARELAEIDRDRQLYKLTSQFKQHYLGEWAIDESGLIYPGFDSVRNSYAKIPPAEYRLSLGVDLGFSPDPSAFVLVGHRDHDPKLYVFEVFKKTEMDPTHVAQKIQEYQHRYPIDQVVIDGANKQVVAELSNRHGLILIPTDKRGKADFMGLLNDDFIQGKVLLSSDACEPLVDELVNLIWDERAFQRTGRRQEAAGCANHLCDALLYVWRMTYNYLAEPKAKTTATGTPEWFLEEEERMFRAAQERSRPRDEMPDFPALSDAFPQ